MNLDDIYNSSYSNCDYSSFKKGFEEGYAMAVRQFNQLTAIKPKDEENKQKLKYKIGDIVRLHSEEYVSDNIGIMNPTLACFCGNEFEILDIVKIEIKDCGYRYVVELPTFGKRYIREEHIECKIN